MTTARYTGFPNGVEGPIIATTLTASGAMALTGTLTVGVDDTGKDVKFYGATSGKYWMWDESADSMLVVGSTTYTGTVTVGVDDTGHDVKFFGATSGKYFLWDESADKVILLGGFDVTGAVNAVGVVTVGVNDTGHDVKFYGATSGKYMLWDESADELIVVGKTTTAGLYNSATALTVSGAIAAGTSFVTLDHASTPIAATIAAPEAGRTLVITQIDAGTAGHTVKLTAGTFDGTNNTATFNATSETLVLYGLTSTRFAIVLNLGSVGLSST